MNNNSNNKKNRQQDFQQTKKDTTKQRAADRMRKMAAQTAEYDIGHIVDTKSASTAGIDGSTAASAFAAASALYGTSPSSPGMPISEFSASTPFTNLPPVNFGDLSHGSSLERSSSAESTGSLFYGKTPNSGAVLGKSSSLIFPTGVETSGGPGASSVPDGAGIDGTSQDPQTDAKRRKVNLLLDQCESIRFPFKKKLMLNNLSLTANDIPLQDLCGGTSLGNSLFKLSLAGNRLGTVPAQLVQNLPALKHLDLSQCELHQLPDHWNLPKLTRLNLSHNRLTDFPEEVRDPFLLVFKVVQNHISKHTQHFCSFILISHMTGHARRAPRITRAEYVRE